MSVGDLQNIIVGFVQGFVSTTAFVLALFIGFCVLVGFTKLKRTAGGPALVVKSLDERVTRQAMQYLPPTAPRGPADQLRAPDLRR